MQKRRATSIYFQNVQLFDQLDDYSRESGYSMSHVITELLELYLPHIVDTKIGRTIKLPEKKLEL